MRKVYIDAEVEVAVTVKVKARLIVRADEDADVDRAVRQWGKGKEYPKADVELNGQEIVAVDGIDHWDDYTALGDWLEEAVENRLEAGKVKLLDAEGTDSK